MENNCNISIEQLMGQWVFFGKRYARTVSKIRFIFFPIIFHLKITSDIHFSEKILQNLENSSEEEIAEKCQKIIEKLGEISNIITKPSDTLEDDLESLEQV